MKPSDLIQGSPYIFKNHDGFYTEVLFTRTITLPNDIKAFCFRTRTGVVNLTKDEVEDRIIRKIVRPK